MQDTQAEKAQQLLHQGHIAYNNWDIKKARLIWRKAAITDPANVNIWKALLNVLHDDEDIIVCLHNILVLTPHDEQIEARLQELEAAQNPPVTESVPHRTQLRILRPEVGAFLSQLIGWLLTLFILLIVGVILFAMLIQPII